MFDSAFENKTALYKKPEHCSCTNGTKNQIKCFPNLLPHGTQAIAIVPPAQGSRRKRSADNYNEDDILVHNDEDDYEFDYGTNVTHHALSWPTMSGITEVEAKATCQDILTSTPAHSTCWNVLSDAELDHLENNCIFDILVTM